MDEFHTPEGDFARPGLRKPPQRWLVICLDGVPLSMMQSLWDRGHFREFHRPTATISTLPSDTETALTSALHAPPAPGYENRYFDRARNRIRGGPWITLSKAGIPYARELDYDPPGWAKACHFVAARKLYRAELGWLESRFRESRRQVFLAHIAASDAVLHILQAPEAEGLLQEFEDRLRRLYLDARGELGILVFSDHGNNLVPSRLVPLQRSLRSNGWRLGRSIGTQRDVVVPAYGLVNFAAVYCHPSRTPSLARDLAELPEVEYAVFKMPDGAGAKILTAGGEARLQWNPQGNGFWYEANSVDSLEMEPLFAKLRREGRVQADSSATDADLLAETWTGPYPDAAARIRDWTINHVQNPADIMVGLKPGYVYGVGVFQQIVALMSTHGGLGAASSLGFAMATYPLPAATRLSELLPPELLDHFQSSCRANPSRDRKRAVSWTGRLRSRLGFAARLGLYTNRETGLASQKCTDPHPVRC